MARRGRSTLSTRKIFTTEMALELRQKEGGRCKSQQAHAQSFGPTFQMGCPELNAALSKSVWFFVGEHTYPLHILLSNLLDAKRDE